MSLGLFLCHMMDGLIDVVIDLEGGTVPCDNLIILFSYIKPLIMLVNENVYLEKEGKKE